MADSDSDDILSADFLEPGELLDSDEDDDGVRPVTDDSCTSSARTSRLTTSTNRPKVRLAKIKNCFVFFYNTVPVLQLNRNAFQMPTVPSSAEVELPAHGSSSNITDKQIQFVLNRYCVCVCV